MPYNATAAQVQTAINSVIGTGATCTGGPLNTNTINVSYVGSEGTLSAYFTPSQVLTL